MRIQSVITPVMIAALSLAAPGGGASAMPRSYAREHPAECAEARAKNTDWRLTCVDRAWCNAHRNDDRKNRIACDPYVSKVDPSLSSITLSQASLNASRDLTQLETF